MNSGIRGNPFFKKHNIIIDLKSSLLHIPELTVQFNKFLLEKGKKRYTRKVPKIRLILTKKVKLSRKYFYDVVWRNYLTSTNSVLD